MESLRRFQDIEYSRLPTSGGVWWRTCLWI